MANSLSGLAIESTGGAYSKYSNTVVDTTKGDEANSYMDFDDYLKVLAAQMSNQDFNDPMSDSEMLQQMSSYSMLEGIKNMTNQSNISYATSLVGKAVTVNDGQDYDTGLVESVVVVDNTPYLVVNGYKYDASTVTNITSSDIYNMLSKLIGQEVNVHGSGEDDIIAEGKVTNVLMLDGNAYVILDNRDMHALKDISLKTTGTDTDNSEDNSDNSSDESSDTTVTDTTVTETEVNASYLAQSDALFSELMSTIDSISGAKTEAVSVVNNVTPNLDGYETVTVTKLEIPDYAAAYVAFYEDLEEQTSTLSRDDSINSVVSNNTVKSTSKITETNSTLTAGLYDLNLNAGNLYTVASNSRTGSLTPTLSNDEVYSIIMSGDYSSRYSEKYGLELYSDSKPGISNSDCEPHRHDADLYPEEAALADALGTRMYDIKYIHNQAIMSRINTSQVVGKTISGREICEIGYSGTGRLGEVVTFKDGKQRVEILFDNGNSGWLETSGRYTLDEIINEQPSDATPFEVSIAYYAKSQSAQKFESLRQNLTEMGVNVVG